MADEQQRLMEIFNEARAKASAEERDAYLKAACGEDAALRRRVEVLLQAHTQMGDFLKPPADDPPDEHLNTVLDRYRLREQIGEGGFGVVYMAEQIEPVRRKVALKIIKAGMDTKEVIARFEAERQALALMDHPNIAKVLDAGATPTGRPYFVMELVNGIPITDYCDRHHLPMSSRLKLFMQVCHAVQHAHQKGIIHRDLKPGNILITIIDGKPVPKIIDFGVAKALGQQLTEKTLFTAFQQIVGTPLYMSPEQAAISGVDVDTRSDIYSLGVLLYELLTGFTPIDAETIRKAGLDEVRRLIREADPPKPSTRLQALVAADVRRLKSTEKPPAALNLEPPGGASSPRLLQTKETIRKVRGDLDWIVMKALEKDRARRYETVNALRADIQRHLEQQPVMAGPPGMAYRAKKYVRRHRVGVALATSVTLALISGLVVALIGFAEARRERDHALAAEEQAEQSHQQAEAERNHAELLAAEATLHKGQEKLEAGDNWGLLDMVKAFELAEHNRGFQETIGRRWSTWHESWDRQTIAVRHVFGTPSPDFLRFASVDGWPPANTSREVRLYDTLTGAVVAGPMTHESVAVCCAFSPDGRLLATLTDKGVIHLWDCETGRPIRSPCETGVAELNQLSFSPDGRCLVAFSGAYLGGPRSVKLALLRLDKAHESAQLLEHRYPVAGARWSPDGKLLAVPCRYELQVWRTSDFTQTGPPIEVGAYVCEFSADGTRLAFRPRRSTGIGLLDTRTMQVVRVLPGTVPASDVGLSHNGHLLASISWDGNLELWKTESEDGPYAAHRFGVNMRGQFAFGHDDSLLAWGDVAGTVRVVRTSDGQIIHAFHTHAFAETAFLTNGVLTARGSFWDLTASPLPGNPLKDDALARALAFDPSGTFLAVGSEDELRLWTMQPSPRLERIIPMPGRVVALTFSEEQGEFVAFSDDGSLTKVEPRAGRTTIVGDFGHGPGWTASLSPDGRMLALFSGDECLVIDTRTTESQSIGHDGFISSVTFRRDSRMLVQGNVYSVKLFDPRAKTNAPIKITKLFGNAVTSVAYHPDGQLLGVCVGGGFLHLYDPGQDRNIGSVRTPSVQVNLARFSTDGRLLAVAGPLQSGGYAVEIWHVDPQRGLFASGVCLRRDQPIWSIAFSPDDAALIVGGEGSTRLWHLPPQPKNLEEVQSQTWNTLRFRMDENGHRVNLYPSNGVEETRARLTQAPASSDTPLEAALKLPPSEALTTVQQLADQHPEMRIYQIFLGRLHADLVSPAVEQGLWSEAEFHARKSLAIRRKALSEEHPDVLDALSRLADVLRAQGKLAEVEVMMREEIAIRRKFSGGKDANLAHRLHAFAYVLLAQDKLEEAESIARDAVALGRRLVGNEHLNVAHSLFCLAQVLEAKQEMEEAEEALREAIEIRRKRLGNGHDELDIALRALVRLLQDQGKSEEAADVWRRELRLRKETSGEEDPSVVRALLGLGNTLASQKKLAEAERTFRQALAIHRKLGKEDRRLDDSLVSLAGVLEDQGKWAEAEEVRREELALEKRLSGEKHPFVANSLSSLAFVLAEQGKLVQARTNLLEAIEMSSANGPALYDCALLCLGTEDTNGYRTMTMRIADQLQTNAPSQNTHLLRWACALAPDAVPDYSPVLQATRQALAGETNTTNSYSEQQTLGALLYRAHQYDEAMQELTKTVELGERLDAKTLLTSPAYGAYFLTMAHARLDHTEEARECFQRASALDPLTTAVNTNAASRIYWNRRLTLELLRNEAESLLNPETPTATH